MKRSRYEQDPDGDVDFVLRDPDGLRRDWPEGYRKRQRVEDQAPTARTGSTGAACRNPDHDHRQYHQSQDIRPTATTPVQGRPSAGASSSPNPEEDVDYDYDEDDIDDGDEEDEEDEYLQERPAKRFRVSSRHLSLASPVFNQMLNGPWKDATNLAATAASISVTADSTTADKTVASAAAAPISNSSDSTPPRREIEASEWDTDATVILMDIIHGHFSQVPRSLSLVMLAKVAILVDYYKCHEIVSVFSGLWIDGLKREAAAAASAANIAHSAASTSSGYPIGHGYGSGGSFIFGAGGGGGVATRSTTFAATVTQGIGQGQGDAMGLWQEECFLWLFTSWVFGESKLFSAMADMFLRKSPLPISSTAFPLPEGLLTALDTARTNAIDSVLASITKLRDDLISGTSSPCPYGMTYECSSMLLGSLIKGLRSLNLSPPMRETYSSSSDASHPVGCSLLGMQNSFARLKRPVWHNVVASAVHNRGVVAHQCNLRGRLDSIVRAAVEGLPKFQLEDFVTSALRTSREEMEMAELGGES